MSKSSDPSSLLNFNPTAVKYQIWVIRLVRKIWNYKKNGLLEILLSGSFGSAKSIIIAHLAVTHCMMFNNARFLLGRKSLNDLKGTIFKKIVEHIEGDLVEGEDYEINKSSPPSIKFLKTKSEIVTIYWADKNFKRIRSIEASAGAIEELTENDGEYSEAFKEFKNRLNRIPSVPEAFFVAATNPDEPRHWAYQYFIKQGYEFKKWYQVFFKSLKNNFPLFSKDDEKKNNRIVFYSVTFDNPFLPKSYIEGVMSTYGPREIQRYIYGKWVTLLGKNLYYSYDPDKNYLSEVEYEIDSNLPIYITHDFNIGVGKPISAAASQYVNGIWHTFKCWSIDDGDTPDIMHEICESGIPQKGRKVIIDGDASGKHRDTRSKTTDWTIVKQYYQDYGIPFEYEVPISNPPVRSRHNIVNGKLCNAKGERSWFIYKGCGLIDDAFALTKLKKGASYVEDDSDAFQHVGTALGYMAFRVFLKEDLERKKAERRARKNK